jgi:lipopolysaccharide transport system permease protein
VKLSPQRFFELVDLQARMALKSEASRLFLSYAWWIIEPILFVLVFYFVFAVLLRTGREDFLLFLVTGKVPFMWFSKSVTQASNTIFQNRGLISQIDIPKAFFPLASVQQSLYREGPVFLLMLLVAVLYGCYPGWHWLLLLPLMLVQYLLILAASCLGAVCVARLFDTRMLINMGMMFLMFTSGVFWDVSAIQNAAMKQWLLWVNPLAFLLDCYRKVIMQSAAYDLVHLALLGIVAAVALAIILVWMHRCGRRIAFWVVTA